uniref:HUN domain-containing protein n=1 Tax=Caenorhabditis tropicalis TaxID=1561998 RepID=A0A1I7UZG5_9PELO
MESISSTKKKKKAGKAKKNELLLVRVWTAKAGSKKYTHVDWDELSANNGRIEDEEDLKRFYDEDTLMMAKKLRETRGKNGKRIHVNLDELQHYNRNAGYDEDDDFIDDSEVVEDGRFSYKKGRFYMGKGEVKEMDEIEEEESS